MCSFVLGGESGHVCQGLAQRGGGVPRIQAYYDSSNTTTFVSTTLYMIFNASDHMTTDNITLSYLVFLSGSQTVL